MKAQSQIPDEVYLSFVESLYGNRRSLFMGMAAQALTFVSICFKTQSLFFIGLLLVMLGVFAYRITWFHRFDALDRQDMTRPEIAYWEQTYIYGAVVMAATLGVGSGYSVLFLHDEYSALASISLTMATMVAVVGRNYGSPTAVKLLVFTACGPIMAGFLLNFDIYFALLGLTLVPFVLTIILMANGVREFLHTNVMARREISIIAERFNIALNNMTHGLLMMDAESKIQVANHKAIELLGLESEASVTDHSLGAIMRLGRHKKLIEPRQYSQFTTELERLLSGNQPKALLQLTGGRYLNFSARRRVDGGTVLIFEDVTEKHLAEEQILRMARFDNLTTLPNRDHFENVVLEKLKGFEADEYVGIMILDIDDFKAINDVQGHVLGDKVLAEVAARLKSNCPENLAGRLIGDEFIVFFGGGRDRAALETEIRQIHAKMQGVYKTEDHRHYLAISGGFAISTVEQARFEELQTQASLALQTAKTSPGGACSAFETEMRADYLKRKKLKSELRQAVENDELFVVYQPMFTADGQKIECCEALVRWKHQEDGPISPAVFIPLAEESGLITRITEMVIKRACQDCLEWPKQLSVSVNLAAADLKSSDIVECVSEVLHETGLPAQRLHLEVTEGSLLEETDEARIVLQELRALGVSIALDDFGTGYSSLNYLDKLPVDIVKIDRSFVKDICEDPRRLKLLSATANLAHELGLKTTIEGVETTDQLELINEHGVADLVQGFVFAAPQPSQHIIELARTINHDKGRRRKISA